MTNDPPTTTPPPGGQLQAVTDSDERAERAILSAAEAYRLVQEAREQRERAEQAEARASHFEALAREQQATNEAMVASLQRGLAQLEASEAEVARLRDDCAALLKILDATYDGSLGRFTRDRISEEINAALDVTGKGGAPADQAWRKDADDGK